MKYTIELLIWSEYFYRTKVFIFISISNGNAPLNLSIIEYFRAI